MRSRPPLPDDVIDRLFSALTVRYGSSFLDRWRDLDIAIVKADWARELAVFGTDLRCIRFGLDNLGQKPPSVIDFKRLCDSAPPPALGISHDDKVRGPTAEEREALRDLSRRIKAGGMFAKPGREWAHQLLADHEAGWRNGRPFRGTVASLAMARDALRQPTAEPIEEPFA